MHNLLYYTTLLVIIAIPFMLIGSLIINYKYSRIIDDLEIRNKWLVKEYVAFRKEYDKVLETKETEMYESASKALQSFYANKELLK